MLILKRKPAERVTLAIGGEEVVLSVIEVHAGHVKLGFDAPDSVRIQRSEGLVRA